MQQAWRSRAIKMRECWPVQICVNIVTYYCGLTERFNIQCQRERSCTIARTLYRPVAHSTTWSVISIQHPRKRVNMYTKRAEVSTVPVARCWSINTGTEFSWTEHLWSQGCIRRDDPGTRVGAQCAKQRTSHSPASSKSVTETYESCHDYRVKEEGTNRLSTSGKFDRDYNQLLQI